MVKCSFCGYDVEPGTGKRYVQDNGTVFDFCSSKCEKNRLKLKRIPRKITWTQDYRTFKGKK